MVTWLCSSTEKPVTWLWEWRSSGGSEKGSCAILLFCPRSVRQPGDANRVSRARGPAGKLDSSQCVLTLLWTGLATGSGCVRWDDNRIHYFHFERQQVILIPRIDPMRRRTVDLMFFFLFAVICYRRTPRTRFLSAFSWRSSCQQTPNCISRSVEMREHVPLSRARGGFPLHTFLFFPNLTCTIAECTSVSRYCGMYTCVCVCIWMQFCWHAWACTCSISTLVQPRGPWENASVWRSEGAQEISGVGSALNHKSLRLSPRSMPLSAAPPGLN